MVEHAEAFFARCAEDAALRERLREAEENYPGSLEIREAVGELRTYETRLKLRNARPDLPVEEDEEIEDPTHYWLLDHGWTYDTDVYPDQLPGTEE